LLPKERLSVTSSQRIGISRSLRDRARAKGKIRMMRDKRFRAGGNIVKRVACATVLCAVLGFGLGVASSAAPTAHITQPVLMEDGKAYEWEFYDDPEEAHGGTLGPWAIFAAVSGINYDGGYIASFTLDVKVTNDTDAPAEALYDVALTIEFADDNDPGTPRFCDLFADTPYDTRAFWPGADGYVIPTWYLGNLLPGEKAELTMGFSGYELIDPASDLGQRIIYSYNNDWDLFLNRSTSEGISDYGEELVGENGTGFPTPPGHSSCVSVFYNPVPEPGLGSIVGLALSCFGIVRLKRRSMPAHGASDAR
jgi:hypothetical protein